MKNRYPDSHLNKFIFPLSFYFLLSISPAFAQNMTFRSHVIYPNGNSNVWGYADSTGKEYALLGTFQGLSIVDVTDADHPVKRFDIPTDPSEWHEIKTWKKHAYVTNESGGGVLIVDMSHLPDTVTYSYFLDADSVETSHTLWIDEHGYLYLFGSNVNSISDGGAIIYDLNPDPEHPVYVSSYNPTGNFFNDYIHDGFVRGDTLWASHIYAGILEVVNMSDKQHPVSLASFNTPGNFTHNSCPTHDDHYLFTTDEVNNSYLTSYDVSDLSNVTLLDKAQSHPGSNAIVHNVHLYNDSFAVTSYYTEGAVIFDITHPDNMIKIAQYDETPLTGGGYGGDWGVYPYLPSHNILMSDIQNGLYVVTPNYVHAAWLYGMITDSLTGSPVNNVQVDVVNTEGKVFSSLSGEYKTGAPASGNYDIIFNKPGYVSKTVSAFSFQSGRYDTLNILLQPLSTFAFSGKVIDSLTGLPVATATAEIRDTNFVFQATTDASGDFSFPAIYESIYQVSAGKWGYHSAYIGDDTLNSSTQPLLMQLSPGYYDDFSVDLGWKVTGDAQYGIWLRAKPVGTDYYGYPCNPGADVQGDHGDECFVTGNSGTNYYDDPVLNGVTELTSPSFDVSGNNNPYLDFYIWFSNIRGNSPLNALKIYLHNGNDSVLLKSISILNAPVGKWVHESIRIKDFMIPSSNMTVSFVAENATGSSNLLECGVDKFQIVDSAEVGINEQLKAAILIQAQPNPFSKNFVLSYEIPQQISEGCVISILNPQGKILDSKNISLDMGTIYFSESALPTGMYFVQLKNKNGILKTVKVVKE